LEEVVEVEEASVVEEGEEEEEEDMEVVVEEEVGVVEAEEDHTEINGKRITQIYLEMPILMTKQFNSRTV
jgi:hypothetical protein